MLCTMDAKPLNLSPGSLLCVPYVLYGSYTQAAEPPLFPSSMLYVLYVLYYSARALKYIICATNAYLAHVGDAVYSIQASIPYSTYSTYSKELGESGGLAACLVRPI